MCIIDICCVYGATVWAIGMLCVGGFKQVHN